MIRNDLKPLLGEGWKEKFVHRDLWDPDGYGVASFDLGGEREKVLAMNLETEDIMEHFFDDLPDDEWISLDRFLLNQLILKNDKYFINRRYEIKNIDNKAIPLTEKKRYLFEKYPSKKVWIDGKQYSLLIHRIIAFIFVPNPSPEKYKIVNHVDSDKENFKKENLEWCDVGWNNTQRKKPQGRFVYLRLSSNGNQILEKFTDIKNNNEIQKNYKSLIKNGYNYWNTDKTYHGYLWKKIDTALEDYISRHPIDPNGWYDDNGLHDFGNHKVRANSCGVLEVDGKLTVGIEDSHRFTIVIDGLRFYTHRLVFEIISGHKADPSLVIDHIIPITKDDINNSFQNLRLVTQSENMNNEITLLNSGKSILQYTLGGDLVGSYYSAASASEKSGICLSTIQKAARGVSLTAGGFIWKYKESTTSLDFYLKFIYYKYSSDGNIISSNIHLSNLFEKGCDKTKQREYLNTGMPAPDGFYYQQGDPENMIYDPDNKELIKKRPKIVWEYRNRE